MQQHSDASEPEEKLLDEHGLRALTGLSHPTIVRLRQNGTLPYFRIGKRILYSPKEVRAAMERQALRPEPKKRR